MRPAPMMPSCLPRSSVPSMKSSPQPFHPPARTSRSPSPTRRAMPRISAHVNSATASVSTSGVLVTTIRRARAAGTSILSYPTAMFATIFRSRAASSTAASTFSVSRQMRASLPSTRRSSSSRGIAPSPEYKSTACCSASSVRIDDGIRRVRRTEPTVE